MFKPKRRLNYANITATLALVFSMSGGALAASHYLINSTKQINPKVLKSLKGKDGTNGANGAPGTTGTTGATGATGTTGATGATGGAGKEGPTGPAGTAVAYAYVGGTAASPSLSNTKNVSSVTRVGPAATKGEYCITTTVPFQNVTGITDLEFGGGGGVTVSADTVIVPILISLNECPAGTSIVVTTGTEKEASKDANFWISFN